MGIVVRALRVVAFNHDLSRQKLEDTERDTGRPWRRTMQLQRL